VVADYGLPEDRVRVVGMGHHPKGQHDTSRKFDTPRFLFVSADWRRKNGPAVLEAFAHVRQRFPTATLDIVGDHPSVNQAGVVAHGFLARTDAAAQRKLDRLFALATVFVSPSLFDPSPIAYLEAASAGLPVIGTTSGGAAELLGDGSLNVHPHDITSIVDAMLRLADGEVAKRIGAKAKQKSEQSTWNHVAGKISDGLLEAEARRLS
jgi:glycosyltransferase involved in cell wall biosynthesis